MDVVKEDMKLVGIREEDAEDRGRWRPVICCGGKNQKEKKKIWVKYKSSPVQMTHMSLECI